MTSKFDCKACYYESCSIDIKNYPDVEHTCELRNMTKQELVTQYPELARELFNAGKVSAHEGCGLDWEQWQSRNKYTVLENPKPGVEYKLGVDFSDRETVKAISREQLRKNPTASHVCLEPVTTTVDGIDVGIGSKYYYFENGEVKERTAVALFELAAFPIFGNKETAERILKNNREPKPDYEILAFARGDGTEYKLTGSANGDNYYTNFSGPIQGVTQQSLIAKGIPISKVKRLSDGMVFTVGDEVYAWGGSVLRKIHGLYVSEGGHLTVKIDSDTGPTAMLLSLRKPERRKATLLNQKEGARMYFPAVHVLETGSEITLRTEIRFERDGVWYVTDVVETGTSDNRDLLWSMFLQQVYYSILLTPVNQFMLQNRERGPIVRKDTLQISEALRIEKLAKERTKV